MVTVYTIAHGELNMAECHLHSLSYIESTEMVCPAMWKQLTNSMLVHVSVV